MSSANASCMPMTSGSLSKAVCDVKLKMVRERERVPLSNLSRNADLHPKDLSAQVGAD